MTFNENVKELLKEYKIYNEFNILLMLPEIQTNSINNFKFGEVSFSNGGDIDELIGKCNRSKEIKEKIDKYIMVYYGHNKVVTLLRLNGKH